MISNELEVLLRVGAAALLGGVIGYDRELRARPAGLRTHMLVALGSALFTGTAMLLVDDPDFGDKATVADVSRVVAAVATGVGFLGAGSIIATRGEVHGLTTAATIWATAAMGAVIGLGYFLVGVGATVLILVVTAFLLYAEEHWFPRLSASQNDPTGSDGESD